MSETEFASVKATLGVTDGELGISTTEPSTKRHICSDWNSENATGDSSGISMPALDESNVKMDPLDRLNDFAGYRNYIRHEMTHLFQSTLAHDNLSGTGLELWFMEGQAVFIGRHNTLLDTLSLADYFAAGLPNPVTVVTRQDMDAAGGTNENMYPAFGLAVKYLFDSSTRGGAGNSLLSTKGLLQQIGSGVSFATAFANTFSRAGAPLTLDAYVTNFQSWMSSYLSNLETPGTVTGASGISMVGIFLNDRWCDLILGLGATVTSSGAFTLNVSELANGSYALCFLGGDGSNVYGPGMVTVSSGRLTPTNYNIFMWPEWPQNCAYTLSPSSYGISSSGGTGNITIIPSSSSCPWAAISNDSWITITSGSDGTGSGTVSYSVAANTTGSAREGTITIVGRTFTMRQAKSTFADDPNNVFTPYIYAIYTEGITVGCGSGMYCSSSNVTRGQMAAFIIRAKYGENFTYTGTPYFSDVPADSTFFKYVQKMKDDGITAVSGTYMVDDTVTREQMAAFIIRAQYGENFTYTPTPYFTDVPSTSIFFKYVQKMKDDGITTTSGNYMASSNVTRDQMAAFLGRAFLGM